MVGLSRDSAEDLYREIPEEEPLERRTAIALSAAVACALFAIASAVTISAGLFTDRPPRVSTIDVVSLGPAAGGSDEAAAPAPPVDDPKSPTTTARPAPSGRGGPPPATPSPTTPATTVPPRAASDATTAPTVPRTVPPTTATTQPASTFPTLGTVPNDDSRFRTTSTTVARSPYTTWPGHGDDD